MLKSLRLPVLSPRAFAAAAGLAGMACSASAAITYQTIALTGTDGPLGPGQGPGVTFSTIGQQQPTIGNSGHVMFRANNSDAGTPHGVWLHGGGANSNQALAGGPQPGGGMYPTGTFVFNNTAVNNNGRMAFRVGASTGLFSDTGSGMGRVMRAGDEAPGTGGATYASVASGTPLFNHANQTGYIAELTANTGTPPVVISGATANAQGIWLGGPGAGNQNLLIRQNDSMLALDPTGNTRVGTFSNSSMSLNGQGHFVSQATLQGSNVVTGTGAGSNSVMLVSNRSGPAAAVARVGDAAPDAAGAPSGTDLFRTIATSGIAFNDSSRMAFTATLRNAAGTQTATGAFFSDANTGTMRMLARNGDLLPSIYAPTDLAGTTPLVEFSGVTWGISYNNPVLNNNDMLVFNPTGLGNTGGTTNTGAIFTMDSSNRFHKLMRNGDVAIVGGAPDGSDAFFLSPSNIQLNDLGQIAFATTLTGVGVSVGLGNGSALYAADTDGALMLVARTGNLFEVAPGDLRTITGIGGIATSGGQDGRLVSLNDLGQLVFELDFAGGSSGVFVATIPEPATLALLMIFGLGALRRR